MGAGNRQRPHRRGAACSRSVDLACCLLGAAALVVGASCSDTDFSSSSPDGGEVDVGKLPRVTSPSPPMPDTPVTAADTTDAPATDAPATTLPTSGVPGIDDGDPLCQAWSQLLGTRQVLTLAANFGDLSPLELARLEVIAAPLVQRATLEFAGAILDVDDPAVTSERDTVLTDLVGPLDRRAAVAVAALTDAGAGRDEGILFAQVWLDGLGVFGPDDVVPTLADLGPELGPMVDAATAAFVVDAPSWTDDPTLDTSGVESPSTLALLDDRCPDLGALGVGDAV